MPKPDYDTTLARMAGNIAGALAALDGDLDSIERHRDDLAITAVALARAIVREVQRTTPKDPQS